MKAKERVFVFGSNKAGRHGAGSALHAVKYHGAKYGIGVGHVGNSYAIPTKSASLQVLPLDVIQEYVEQFLDYARIRQDLMFDVVRIGCGLAGYKDFEIAPMFRDIPSNVVLDKIWVQLLGTVERALG